MIIIDGTIQNGLGAAKDNLAVQIPLIAAEFPEIVNCHRGTINVLLDIPLLVLTPDHRTTPIPWHPNFTLGEIFDLLRVKFEVPIGAAAVPSWLYIPHGSPHRREARIHEVISSTLNISTGSRCRVHIQRNVIPMPYYAWPLVIVI